MEERQSQSKALQRVFDPANRKLLVFSTIFMLLILGLWGFFTPGSILSKADAVGYAVCHRIEVRSFVYPSGRILPLCARCTGTFLGVLIGLFVPALVLRRRKQAGFPPLVMIAVMLVMSAWWAFDGTNSYMHLLPYEGLPRLYSPTNFLRLTTGTFHGITMGSLILPVVNSTLWAEPNQEGTIDRWWHLLVLYAVGVVMMIMVLSEWAVFLYPLGVLSSLGVAAVLSAICVVLVATILRKENTAHSVGDALPLIFLGIAAAFIIIGAIDAARFAAFGTWDGFDISGLQSIAPPEIWGLLLI